MLRLGRRARGWTALCLLALLTASVVVSEDNSTAQTIAVELFSSGVTSTTLQDVSTQEIPVTSSSGRSPQTGDNAASTAIMTSELTTRTSLAPSASPVPSAVNTSVQARTSVASTVASVTTPANGSSSKMPASVTPEETSTAPANTSATEPARARTPGMPYSQASTLAPPTGSPSQVVSGHSIPQGRTYCVGLRGLKLSLAICLNRAMPSSCETFRSRVGEVLADLLCPPEPRSCSLLLTQSEVRPHCLLLVGDNQTELDAQMKFLEDHKAELKKLGIDDVRQEMLGDHQSSSSSRKTLIALVTSGTLLAVLGLAGYFLMNRHSWSPAGERLGEDPYFTEAGVGSEVAPDYQGKSSGVSGAQENGTDQASSRNGHSVGQQAVTDTPL